MRILLICLLLNGISFSWTSVSVNQNPPIHAEIMGWEKVVFASAINSAVVLGGYDLWNSEHQNALMAYSPDENRWNILDLVGGGKTKSDYITAGGHDFGSPAYDENLHAVVTTAAWAMGNYHAGYCQYDVRGNVGRNYYATSPMGNLQSTPVEVSTAFDSDSGCIYYLGGEFWGGDWSHKFCRYRPSDNRWKILADCPTGSQNVTPAYDKIRKRLITPFGMEYDPAADSWASASTPSGDLYYNELNGRVEGASFSGGQHRASRTMVFTPFNNKRIGIGAGGSGWYPTTVSTEPSSASGTKPLLTFTKESCTPDARWTQLGGAVENAATGWAPCPAIANHKGELYIAWSEWDAARWDNDGRSRVYLDKWNGSSWVRVASGLGTGNHNDHPMLFSDGTDLYIGVDNNTFWVHPTALHYRYNGSGIDTLVRGGPLGDSLGDTSSLPRIVKYRGQIHSIFHIYPRNGTMHGSFGHSVWNETAKRWDVIDKEVFPYQSTVGAIPQMLSNAFSAEVKGDSIVVAYTAEQATNLPLTVKMKAYNGTVWTDMPNISASATGLVCTHPCLATNTQRTELYVGYLRRAYVGRANNELIVERFNGTGWTPLGNPLNVNSAPKDVWAFRPSLAVNSKGVLFAAWSEHVWGSCPQVYVAHWNGSGWVRDFDVGKSLNIDGANGSAQNVSLTFINDKPTVAWSEHVFGGGRFRKVYVKQMDDPTALEQSPLNGSIPGILASPNPFHGSVEIIFGKQPVSFAVYDIHGRVIRNLNSENGRTLWNPKGLPCGIYILKAKINGRLFRHRLNYLN